VKSSGSQFQQNKPSNFTRWCKVGFIYLSVFLWDPVRVNKNWEGVPEKWRRLLLQMSYRGRVLIINNLVSSGRLWHKLACVDPLPWTC